MPSRAKKCAGYEVERTVIMLGIGIVGAGVIFQDHMRAYAQLPGRARVVGLADVDPLKMQRATNLFFIPFTTEDYRDLIDHSDTDVIVICTPPSSHEEIAVAALRAGKHVICEKPLAHTLESADRIIEACKTSSGKLSTVYQLRFLPEIERIIWLRDHGWLGQLQFATFIRTECLKKTASMKSGWWGRWSVAGGGAAMTQFIHDFDLMLHLFGPASEVSGVMDTRLEGIESEDTFAATIRFDSGALVSASCTAAGQRHSRSISIFGESGSVHLPWALECSDPRRQHRMLREALQAVPSPSNVRRRSRPVRLLLGGLRKVGLLQRPRPQVRPHAAYVRAALNAFETGTEPPTDAGVARDSLELCVALYDSALSGRPVSLPLSQTSKYYTGISSEDYRPRAAETEASSGRLPAPVGD